jgi:hypothetical protein
MRRALAVDLEMISDSRLEVETGWSRSRTRTAESIGGSGVSVQLLGTKWRCVCLMVVSIVISDLLLVSMNLCLDLRWCPPYKA